MEKQIVIATKNIAMVCRDVTLQSDERKGFVLEILGFVDEADYYTKTRENIFYSLEMNRERIKNLGERYKDVAPNLLEGIFAGYPKESRTPDPVREAEYKDQLSAMKEIESDYEGKLTTGRLAKIDQLLESIQNTATAMLDH